MVTDEQVRRLFMLVSKEPTKVLAADKSGELLFFGYYNNIRREVSYVSKPLSL